MNIEELVDKYAGKLMFQNNSFRAMVRNALTEQAEAFKGELQAYDGMVRELTKTVEDMQAAQPVPVVGEPVAWVSTIECIGPEYKKNLFGRLPIQSLQAGYYSHTALYEQPTNSITAAELATLREKAAMVDELRKDAERMRNALVDIADWTDRYTKPGHPISTVARAAIAGEKK